MTEDDYYRALESKDRRFDGVFFVAVSTTGVYCRPICPARTARRDRCSFYASAAHAEKAGYRACFRCRPERAPGIASVDSTRSLASLAAERIDRGALDDASVAELAQTLKVSERQLRRAMEQSFGTSPLRYAMARRVAAARMLVMESKLPLTEIAFAAGFQSVRTFNTAFSKTFGRPPSSLRRAKSKASGSFELRLDYRPPLAWDALLAFIAMRATPSEAVADGVYTRNFGESAVRVHNDPGASCLRVTMSNALAPQALSLVHRLRRLFDLDARPDIIDAHLGRHPALKRLVKAHPGMRVPGTFDPFETTLRTVLGQQVSVKAASTLMRRLLERYPDRETLKNATAEDVAQIGIPKKRAETLIGVARCEGSLEGVPGIGPWTRGYLAMRIEHWPDAWPTGDLVLKHALSARDLKHLETLGEGFRPWRAYAVMHLWTGATK